jgi:hypothetical protein
LIAGEKCSDIAGRSAIWTLRQYLPHHARFVAGADEALVEALVGEAEAFGVEAEEVQDRGLEVVDADLVLGDEVAQFVGRAVDMG